MSMLAEPRRKTKWTLNPRGKLWSEDRTKFGQKLLEKMGWKEGKGLGANEQGITSHIHVQVKSDNTGVGFKGKDTDWCKHQAQFDEVLATLSQNMGGVGGHQPSNSLEERSKASRARLHYKKFTREKDVSKYSSKDLGCILGVPKENPKEKNDDNICPVEDVGAEDDSFGVKTVVGGNIHDYLNRKKIEKNQADPGGSSLGSSSGCKKKREDDKLDSKDAPEDTQVNDEPGCSNSVRGKKRKRLSNFDDENESESQSSPDSTSEEGDTTPQKKDSRCHSAANDDAVELTACQEGEVYQGLECPGSKGEVKKGKKKLRGERGESRRGHQREESGYHVANVGESLELRLCVGDKASGTVCPDSVAEPSVSQRARLNSEEVENETNIPALPSRSEFREGNIPDSTTEPTSMCRALLEEEKQLSQAGTVDEMLEIMVLGGSSKQRASGVVRSNSRNLQSEDQITDLMCSQIFDDSNSGNFVHLNPTDVEGVCALDNIVKKKKKKSVKAACGQSCVNEMSSGSDKKKMLCNTNANSDTPVLEDKSIGTDDADLGKAEASKEKKKRKKKSKVESPILESNSCLTNKASDEATVRASSMLFKGANLDKIQGYGSHID